MDRKTKRQILAWAICLCLLLLFEAGLRLRLGKGRINLLARMGFSHQTEFDRQTAAFEMARDRGRQVFLIGDSTMGVGFHTTIFRDMPGNPGFTARNLAYGGMSWETRLAAIQYVPDDDENDKILVIGTAYFSMARPMFDTQALEAACLPVAGGTRAVFLEGMGRDERSLEHRLQFTLGRACRIYAASSELRKFARHLCCYPTWYAPKFESWTAPEFCEWSRAAGYRPADNGLEPRPDFNPEGRAAFMLRKIITMSREKGLKILLVNMPVTRQEMSRIPADGYERYLALLQGLDGHDGVTFVDMNRGQIEEEGHFTDEVHLNAEGEAAFTRMLGGKILKMLEE